MLYFLVAVVLIGLGLYGAMAIYHWSRDALDNNRKALVESERALGEAEKTFRRIANGSANPVLEAQIALDEITNYHSKEIV